jgi:hypothetical protein
VAKNAIAVASHDPVFVEMMATSKALQRMSESQPDAARDADCRAIQHTITATLNAVPTPADLETALAGLAAQHKLQRSTLIDAIRNPPPVVAAVAAAPVAAPPKRRKHAKGTNDESDGADFQPSPKSRASRRALQPTTVLQNPDPLSKASSSLEHAPRQPHAPQEEPAGSRRSSRRSSRNALSSRTPQPNPQTSYTASRYKYPEESQQSSSTSGPLPEPLGGKPRSTRTSRSTPHLRTRAQDH